MFQLLGIFHEEGRVFLVNPLQDFRQFFLVKTVFDNFQQTTLVKKNSKVATVTDDGKTAELVAKQKVTWPSKDGEASRITSTFSVQSNQGVPMEEGDVAGVMRFYLDGKKIGQTKLLYHYPES